MLWHVTDRCIMVTNKVDHAPIDLAEEEFSVYDREILEDQK
jgi:hypothetical protein